MTYAPCCVFSYASTANVFLSKNVEAGVFSGRVVKEK